MDVINFGHGAFISVGAFVGVSVLLALGGWTDAAVAAPQYRRDPAGHPGGDAAVTGALGWGFERLIVRPVYGVISSRSWSPSVP
jgi:branched-chain amino acid transport system permease protein